MGRGEVIEHLLSDLFFFGAESGWGSHEQSALVIRCFSADLHCDLRDSKAEKVD